MNLIGRHCIFVLLLALMAACSDSPEDKKSANKPAATIEALQAKAESGNAEAQDRLARCYFEGEGLARDEAKAALWFRKAAEQGNANGQRGLGYCYHSGSGLEKDSTQAFFWWRKAAEQGHVYSQNSLAHSYKNGVGVTKDEVQAVYWWRKASEQGDSQAQYRLGFAYEEGSGVVKDLNEAYAYFSLAGMRLEDARRYLKLIEGSEYSSKRLSREEITAGQKRAKELQKEIEAKKAGK